MRNPILVLGTILALLSLPAVAMADGDRHYRTSKHLYDSYERHRDYKKYYKDRSYRHKGSHHQKRDKEWRHKRDRHSFQYHGERYHHRNGHYYRYRHGKWYAVRPPVGLVVTVIPSSYRVEVIGGRTYYNCQGIYYHRVRGGYVVVERPIHTKRYYSHRPLTLFDIQIGF